MRISTIIVTYNSTKNNWITKCLDSLLKSTIKTEIIIIDNSSTDDTLKIIKENYPQIELIESKENLGFAKANNIGIKKAFKDGADYVFLMNHDVWIERDTIELLIKAYKRNESFGILSPIHLNGDGTNLDYNFTNYISDPNTEGRLFLFNLIKKTNLKEVYSMKFVNAASWFIPKKTFKKVGLFDDILFSHYGEDGNYIQRVLLNKLKIGIVPNALIYHDREKRSGKQTNSVFNKNYELKEFILEGSNPLDQESNIKMNRSINFTKRKIFKSIIFFKIKNLLKEVKIFKLKLEYKKLILIQKNKY